MNSWITKVKYYLNKFIEVGVLLLAASVLAEIIFGPDVAFLALRLLKIWSYCLILWETKGLQH